MSRRRTLACGWLLALIGIALFARLGLWQLDRMRQKQTMLDSARAVVQLRRALPLAAAGAAQRRRAYDWSAGAGRFAALPAILLDNQARDNRTGVRAYRVFLPVDAAPLLVELGWLPLAGDRRMPSVPRPDGVQRIAGLLLPPPSAGIARASVQPQADGALLTIALDVPLLRRALALPALAPRVLKLDPAAPLGYARDLEVLPNTLPPERHLGYAVQWFGLALTVLATAVLLTVRKPRR